MEQLAKFLHTSFSNFCQRFDGPSLMTSLKRNVMNRGYLDLPTQDLYFLQHSNKDVIDLTKLTMGEAIYFTWMDVKISLYLLKGNPLPPLTSIIKKLCAFIHLMHAAKMPKRTHMSVILTGFANKKKLPNRKSEMLTPYHVNGGCTWSVHGEHQTIIVYRKEELFKVLLHEILHFYGNDEALSKHNAMVANYEKILAQRFALKTTGVELHECYNDFVTCLFALGYSIVLRNPNISLQVFKVTYAAALQESIDHMACVTTRILAFFDFKGVKETTPVFSYYVCKTALMCELDTMLKLIHMKGGEWKLNERDVGEYIRILDSGLRSKQLKRLIDMSMKNCVGSAKSIRMLNVDV